MKFITTIAIASTFVAAATAQRIAIYNPTVGSQWTVGKLEFLGWTGNCAGMGNDSRTVGVELVEGPADFVRFVADLGTIDCSGAVTKADITVDSTVKGGEYSIRVKTSPEDSYSNAFTINNAGSPAAPSSAPPAPTTGVDKKPDSAASSLAISSLLALTGAAAAALQFAL
ncbi:hypothetical protein BG011_007533 [Mortierella polycephala]|uniref:Uncharacterized protein n=1 Tax=Mortierella polycephala TaxID=41804 RepID=A0A9P6PRW4_9FUNG|nr:hypothetical protein BG011_007533 [Mortierella polycephala]